MLGITKSEMLNVVWKGNAKGMEQAIEEGDIIVSSGFYHWKRDIHERITGGKQTFHFCGGDPRDMSPQEFAHMMSLLDHAQWVAWAAKSCGKQETTSGNF